MGEAGIHSICYEREGRIRENLTIHGADGRETRISFMGFSVTEEILSEIGEKIHGGAGDIVTLTGRMPDGIGLESAKSFLIALREKGVRVVLDSRSFPAEDIMEVRPWLIKPNQEEISAYFGCTIENFRQAVQKAEVFSEHGIENVMISLGSQGAALLSGGCCHVAAAPEIDAISTIGAGDSSIAGFLAAAAKGADAEECLRNSVACGTAACLTDGSQPPRREDIQLLRQRIKMRVI